MKKLVWLTHRPSLIAAACLIAAINVSLSPKVTMLIGVECT